MTAHTPVEMPDFKLCRCPTELYLPPARKLILQAIPAFFETHKISVIELLHNSEWVRTLENSEMMLQIVLQRAVMLGVRNGGSIRDLKAQLEGVVHQAMMKLRRDTRNHLFPDIKTAEGFAELADSMHGDIQDPYILNGALAHYLRPAPDVNARIFRLIAILEASSEDHPGWPLLHGAIDEILAELISVSTVLPDLVGETRDYGELLLAYARLFLSHPLHGHYGLGQGLDMLAWHFAAGDLQHTHCVVGETLKSSISAHRRLCDGPPREELQRFRQLSQLIISCIGPHLKRRDIQPELNIRSARLASPEQIHECLQAFTMADKKVAKLFFIESCICDGRSRYRLADMIFRFSTASSFHQTFHSSSEPLVNRLHRLADLNRAALGSGFDEDQRQKLASIYDHLANEIAQKERLFYGIEQHYENIAEKTVNIARLFYAGHITEGKLARAARKRMMYYTRQSGFLEQYIAFRLKREGRRLDRTQALIDIGLGMKRVGIDPEIALYRVAQ